MGILFPSHVYIITVFENYEIHEVYTQYQEMNKTTSCGFFALVVKGAICSGILPENQISAG